MQIKGRAVRLGDDINTDFIISGRYKFSITDIRELSRHIMEDIDPDFPRKIVPGRSIIVAGRNFGMGSSREQAPLVIKECGIVAVVARTFARIFYRNAFNIGLALIEADTRQINENDILLVDLGRGILKDISKDQEAQIKPLPAFMQDLLKTGGIVNYFKKYGELRV